MSIIGHINKQSRILDKEVNMNITVKPINVTTETMTTTVDHVITTATIEVFEAGNGIMIDTHVEHVTVIEQQTKEFNVIEIL